MKILSDKIQLSPTDLSNHLGCRHLTELNRQLALGKIPKPSWADPALAVLIKRGEEHEQAYVRYLQSTGLSVINLKGQTNVATYEAMRNGYDVIVQAGLAHDGWLGYADILFKVAMPSAFGNWSYEVRDTKLSRNTRAATILQLSLYTEIVSTIQNLEPAFMGVVKPDNISGGTGFELENFRCEDFKAYYRLAKKALVKTIYGKPQDTYPEPVEHCSICRWWKECDKKRHDDDHLSLIASIRPMHIGELQKQDITTLEQFAQRDYPLSEKPERGNIESYEKIHGQAKIQYRGRREQKLVYELLPFEEGRGLARLPKLSRGDIYFDIEGDPFFDQLGLEYLLGYTFVDNDGNAVYKHLWARDRAGEREAFDRFMTFVMARLREFPDLHIYHFAPYEPSTIKRLSLRHTLHEENLDWLLRAERFIDLHAVAKEGIRASVERYSLKDLERFTPYLRKVELPVASSARRTVEFALELNDSASLTQDVLALVQDYNEDDCRATHALHLWLENLRMERIATGFAIARPELKTGDASEPISQLDTRTRLLFNDLTSNLPLDRGKWNDEEKAKWLLANQLDYFRRELKSAYWEFFRLHELDYDAALDERKAIAGLKFISALPLKPRQKTPVHRYSFPPQEIGLKEGCSVHEVMGEHIGSIDAIDHETCTVDIKKSEKSKDVHPVCIHEKEVVDIEELGNAVANIALSITEEGFGSMSHRAAKDLLMKRRPRLAAPVEGRLVDEGEELLDGAIRLALQMKSGVLGIQGPPGSGKTHTGAMMILQLAQKGKRIGVTATSHKVILNLFRKVLELSARHNIPVSLMHKAKEEDEMPAGIEKAKNSRKALDGLRDGKVVGGTAWLWVTPDARETLDYLFVDEAGQMSLAHVLAASAAARNVILLGDPQQLEQPQKASHPEGADVAALSHLLDGHATMPDDKGIFLSTTRRLHPAITQFTSEVFYEGRLASLPGLDRHGITGNTPFAGAGLFYIPVEHSGNQNRSQEEADVVFGIATSLVSTNLKKTDHRGVSSPVTQDDIVIVAPYNAQVAALSERLPGYRIGTVDKFQGQEAAIVIYSMTSSSADDAPRGMSFLYNPNRLNVATSRAQCVAILVATERLLEVECRTIEQMRWANALCRFRELAIQSQ